MVSMKRLPMTWRTALQAGAALIFAALTLHAAPVLHEFFDFDGRQDATPGAATGPGATGSGANAEVAAAAGTNAAGGSQYRLDGDTSRPDEVGYEDPFTPAIPPFKRLFAFDSVGSDFDLVVADTRLSALAVGGKPLPSDDQFFADLPITLSPGQNVRIPSVGPGARILAAQTIPASSFELLTDSAENWFARSTGAEVEGHLILHLAIDRDVFGTQFSKVSWARLAQALPGVPRQLRGDAQEVLATLQLDHRVSPDDAVRRLIEYFRGFEPSEESVSGDGAALYRSIALSRRGVCRHRAFAFTITALALGIPTRFVHNEAHAWVEVNDGHLWHRIDLGGAAGHVSFTGPLQEQHQAPRDPYPWPPAAEPGQGMVENALRRQGAGSPPAVGSSSNNGAAPDASGRVPGAVSVSEPGAAEPAPPSEEDTTETESKPQPTHVFVRSKGKDARRGERIAVDGYVEAEAGCSLLRIDVELSAQGTRSYMGTLVTDAQGRFAGELVVPERVPVGDYAIIASTPGNVRCGAGSSELTAP
jgi:Transglutaminase-like superfamily